MNIDDIKTLYDYNYWASWQILGAARRVTVAQSKASAASPHGRVRGTLIHLLNAESYWRTLLEHNTRAAPLTAMQFPTLDSLEYRWREEEKAMRSYLASLTDQDVNGVRELTSSSGRKREFVLWHCLAHVVNHGTQHRSEAAVLLTEYGQSPGDLDLLVFIPMRGDALT